MKDFNIRLTQNDVPAFVKAASACDFNIEIFYGRYIVDAKSLLGVFSLDLRQVLTVRLHGSDPDFEAMLRGFVVKNAIA
ncbi:MAG: HPr family phosphocarrier protein [bacterium]